MAKQFGAQRKGKSPQEKQSSPDLKRKLRSGAKYQPPKRNTSRQGARLSNERSRSNTYQQRRGAGTSGVPPYAARQAQANASARKKRTFLFAGIGVGVLTIVAVVGVLIIGNLDVLALLGITEGDAIGGNLGNSGDTKLDEVFVKAEEDTLYQNGDLTLYFEAGSVLEDTHLSIYDVSAKSIFPDDGKPVGSAFNIEMDNEQLTGQVLVTLPYDELLLPADEEENVVLTYFNEETSEWITLSSWVDTEENTVSAYMNHFTWVAPWVWLADKPPEIIDFWFEPATYFVDCDSMLANYPSGKVDFPIHLYLEVDDPDGVDDIVDFPTIEFHADRALASDDQSEGITMKKVEPGVYMFEFTPNGGPDWWIAPALDLITNRCGNLRTLSASVTVKDTANKKAEASAKLDVRYENGPEITLLSPTKKEYSSNTPTFTWEIDDPDATVTDYDYLELEIKRGWRKQRIELSVYDQSYTLPESEALKWNRTYQWKVTIGKNSSSQWDHHSSQTGTFSVSSLWADLLVKGTNVSYDEIKNDDGKMIYWNVTKDGIYYTFVDARDFPTLILRDQDYFGAGEYTVQLTRGFDRSASDPVTISVTNEDIEDFAEIEEIDELMAQGWGGSTYVVMVIDQSGSMDEVDPGGINRIDAAKTAADQLIGQLLAENDSIDTDHQIAVVSFDDDPIVRSPFGSDPSRLDDALRAIQSGGGTDLSDGFDMANDLLADERSYGTSLIVLMTDGNSDETISELRSGPIKVANQNHTCLITVAFGSDANYEILEDIADSSVCGRAFQAWNTVELKMLYAAAAMSVTSDDLSADEGYIAQGEVELGGTYEVTTADALLKITLVWKGSILEPEIYDPDGNFVPIDGYKVRVLSTTPTSISLAILNPKAGRWSFNVKGVDVPDPDGEEYYLVYAPVPLSRVEGEELEKKEVYSEPEKEVSGQKTPADLTPEEFIPFYWNFVTIKDFETMIKFQSRSFVTRNDFSAQKLEDSFKYTEKVVVERVNLVSIDGTTATVDANVSFHTTVDTVLNQNHRYTLIWENGHWVMEYAKNLDK